MKNIDLTETEISVIENALNAHWHEAKEILDRNAKISHDGTRIPLGDIEKQQLSKRLELILPLIRKIENL